MQTFSILIADDDEITREGIRRYLLKTFPDQLENIWTAKDGQEAFSLYENYQPDLLFTDIAMPRCDGLELIENLHQSGYTPKTVVISAHENFSYAQNAVRLGVGDYLLKPILPAKIKEITQKLLTELEQHNTFLTNINEMMAKYKENLPVLQERLFNSLLQEDLPEDRILEKAKLVDVDLSGVSYTVAVLKVASAKDTLEHTIVADRFANFLATVIDIMFPAGIRVYYIMVNSCNAALIIAAEKESRRALFRTVNNALNRLLRSAKKYADFSVCGAVGRQYESPEGISQSYREALDALISVEEGAPVSIRNYEDISPDGIVELKMDGELENKLLQSVKYQPYDRCLELITQLERSVASYQYKKFRYIQTYILKVTVLMWRELQNCNGGREAFPIDFNELLATESLDSLMSWFSRFVRNVTESYRRLNEEKGSSLLNKAQMIINDNLGNCEFSIDEVASALYISSNYLRQIFRQQAGESFVEYLTRIRMEKALELLKNPAMKIQDISEATGFSNQRYFAVCFKKHFGKTPTEYRVED